MIGIFSLEDYLNPDSNQSVRNQTLFVGFVELQRRATFTRKERRAEVDETVV